uniref:WW domain-containing oxidoreductase n=1 Tax=Magallana gigas TaxID=29159 RepID=A0A8W8N740_MAGGI
MGGSPSFPREPLSPEKVVIVTGGNTGIGYETAKWIAMMGAHVIIACRTKERALHAITRMEADFEQEKQKGTSGLTSGELSVEFMELDLSSLKSTQKFIEEFKASGKPLHVLICNAGLGMHPLTYTEDGNELMFQVMQMYSLNQRINQSNVTVNSLHPGVVHSEFTRSFEDDCTWTCTYNCAKCFGVSISPYKGAITSIDVAVNSKHSGVRDVYFDKCAPASPSPEATNVENQEQLWKFSLDCLKDYITEEDLNNLGAKT